MALNVYNYYYTHFETLLYNHCVSPIIPHPKHQQFVCGKQEKIPCSNGPIGLHPVPKKDRRACNTYILETILAHNIFFLKFY